MGGTGGNASPKVRPTCPSSQRVRKFGSKDTEREKSTKREVKVVDRELRWWWWWWWWIDEGLFTSFSKREREREREREVQEGYTRFSTLHG